jgi:very-short-patch-repair endonuclease
MAACLAGGPFTAASHLAAGWVHGLARIAPGTVEITIYGDCAARLKGVRTHESVFLHPDDRASVDGIPTTSPARTIMDLAAVASAWLLPKLLDDMLRRHLCTPAEVQACVERIGGRGRAGTAFLRVLAQERVDGHHPGDNDWEVTLARALTAAGLPPAQQHQVVVGNRVFLIDLAYTEYKVGVEFKGWDPRSVRTAFDHDAERDLLLEGIGWHMIAATSRTRHRDVIRAVQSAIECRKAALDRELDEEGGQPRRAATPRTRAPAARR